MENIKIGQNSYSEEEALAKAIGFHKAGDLKKAEYFYHFINKHFPKNADVLHLSALILYHYGWLDSAIYWLKRAITLNNEKPQYHYNLGILYLEKKELDLAKKCFDAALSANANYSPAKAELMKFNH